MAGEVDTLNALLRQLEAAHKANREEIKAEGNREMADLKRMVTGVLERAGLGDDLLSEHEAKEARLKDPDESDAHHTCD